jgi:hypothetical protein
MAARKKVTQTGERPSALQHLATSGGDLEKARTTYAEACRDWAPSTTGDDVVASRAEALAGVDDPEAQAQRLLHDIEAARMAGFKVRDA